MLERIAGATTDIQYVIHQGFTAYGATFWVGANAPAPRARPRRYRRERRPRGAIRFADTSRTARSSRTRNPPSISSPVAGGFYNYPERLAFSATPQDFGALLIQRRRWANGGLLILPKLMRYLGRRPSPAAAFREGFMRCHYLASLTVVNAGLLLMLTLPFDDDLAGSWIPLTALPYFSLYARDLRRSGYRAADVLRVFALNLMLIPVNLGGVFLSMRQMWTKQKKPLRPDTKGPRSHRGPAALPGGGGRHSRDVASRGGLRVRPWPLPARGVRSRQRGFSDLRHRSLLGVRESLTELPMVVKRGGPGFPVRRMRSGGASG